MASTGNGNRIKGESPYSMLTTTTDSSTSTLQTRSSPSPPDTRMTSLVDISYLHHQQQHQESYSIHNGTESGLLQAPRPQFLSKSSNNNNLQNNNSNNNNNQNSRPASFASSSTSSRGSSGGGGGGGRVQLQSTSLSYMRNGGTSGESSLTSSMTELELREEAAREGLTVPRNRGDQYASERPLETVNRLSRMWDTVPAASLSPQSVASTSTANRRVSRLPLAVGGFDPFGYGVSTESSPYDSALAYSNSPKNRMSSRASWYPSLDENGSLSNIANSNSFVGLAMLNQSPSSSGSITDLNRSGEAPWAEKKRRSVSLGEMGRDGRSALRNSFLSGGRSGSGPSKLSGEIGVDNEAQSLASMGLPVSKGFVPPADQDFIKSKLYQRTLKAQKSLDKERARKGTGQRSVSDNTSSKSTKYANELHVASDGRRKSGASFISAVSASDANSLSGRSVLSNSEGKKRGSFGWLRSKSDVAISSMVAPPVLPPMPSPYRQHSPLSPVRPLASPRLEESPQLDQDREIRSRSVQSRQSDHELSNQLQNQQRRPSSVPLPSPPLPSSETRSVPPSPSSSYRRNLPQTKQQNQSSRLNSPIIDYYSHQPRLSASYASQLPLPPSPGSDYFPLAHQPQQSQQHHLSQYDQFNTSPHHSPTPSHEPQLYMRERARSPLNTNTTHYQPEEVESYHRPAPSPPSTAHRQPQASFEQERDFRSGTESQMMENSSSGSSSTTSPITPLPSLESIHPVLIQEPEMILPPSGVSHQSIRSNQNYDANNNVENNYYGDISVDSTTPKKSKSSLNLFFSGLGGKKEEKSRKLERSQPHQLPEKSKSNFVTTENGGTSHGSSGGTNFFGKAKKSFVTPISSSPTSSTYTSSPSPPVKNAPLPPVPRNNSNLPKSKSFTFLSKPFSRSSSSSTINSKNNSSSGVLIRSKTPSAATQREYPSPQAVQESILLHSNRSNNSPSYTNVY